MHWFLCKDNHFPGKWIKLFHSSLFATTSIQTGTVDVLEISWFGIGDVQCRVTIRRKIDWNCVSILPHPCTSVSNFLTCNIFSSRCQKNVNKFLPISFPFPRSFWLYPVSCACVGLLRSARGNAPAAWTVWQELTTHSCLVCTVSIPGSTTE